MHVLGLREKMLEQESNPEPSWYEANHFIYVYGSRNFAEELGLWCFSAPANAGTR